MIQRRELLQAGAGALVGVAAPSFAQSAWPDKPVKIVVLFNAGGTADTLTRILAEKLQTNSSRVSLLKTAPARVAISAWRR